MNVAAVREFLLAFADDEHLMGQQHTEWIGVAPFLEEDLAFSSIGQDELGHAALLYELVLELDGIKPTDTAIDELAFGRASHDYRSCHLVEYSTRHWAEALVRHWIYDTFEELRWRLLIESALPSLASITHKALREEVFHRRHANALLDKLLEAPEAQARIAEALEVVAPMVPGLCEPPAGETEAITAGVTAGSTADLLKPLVQAMDTRFTEHSNTDQIEALLNNAKLDVAEVDGAATETADTKTAVTETAAATSANSGRSGRSEFFAPLMTRMREVLDYDLTAVW